MTDDQLINALGGCTAVANFLGIKPPSVSGWNSIPLDKKILLAVIAEDHGICTRKELFPDSYQNIWIELRPEFNTASSRKTKLATSVNERIS
ncbi:Cro/CI family transcriptional regulator [Alkanindiges illinoisensis]|uniref:Cro/CI family transcriptional regulator n=1 Tax=Alkanindiges illinoisensis TaxID=197183 RepID=UPI00047C345E|nr:Cro/CI family transcriptional regulator [Alkanindiges illinoisensis]